MAEWSAPSRPDGSSLDIHTTASASAADGPQTSVAMPALSAFQCTTPAALLSISAPSCPPCRRHRLSKKPRRRRKFRRTSVLSTTSHEIARTLIHRLLVHGHERSHHHRYCHCRRGLRIRLWNCVRRTGASPPNNEGPLRRKSRRSYSKTGRACAHPPPPQQTLAGRRRREGRR